jgi:signal transduction histidine kinase
MSPLIPTVLLITQQHSQESALSAAFAELQTVCCLTCVPDFAAARASLNEFVPDIIVLHASSLHSCSPQRPTPFASLPDVVRALAGFAPVLILGEDHPSASLASLLASGAAEFFDLARSGFSGAVLRILKRLQLAPTQLPTPLCSDISQNASAIFDEHFGELLRHELNNPLTGILGNAELLLAETRRQSGAKSSDSAIRRLETIAALAVRMRETVRRLSRSCEQIAQRANSA